MWVSRKKLQSLTDEIDALCRQTIDHWEEALIKGYAKNPSPAFSQLLWDYKELWIKLSGLLGRFEVILKSWF